MTANFTPLQLIVKPHQMLAIFKVWFHSQFSWRQPMCQCGWHLCCRHHHSSVNCSTVDPRGGTVRCRYNAVNFLSNDHKWHTIAWPGGQDIGCLLWVRNLVYLLRYITAFIIVLWWMGYVPDLSVFFFFFYCISTLNHCWPSSMMPG